MESNRRARISRFFVAVSLLALPAIVAGPSAGQERLVSKQDADRIFALNRSQWEAEVKRMLDSQTWRLLPGRSDQGTGVAESELEHMFHPFVTTKSDGIGLGLSVCRSIAAAHHGRIWATRNVERGITMHLELPGIDTAPVTLARGA